MKYGIVMAIILLVTIVGVVTNAKVEGFLLFATAWILTDIAETLNDIKNKLK